MAANKITMPSGMGGIVRYSEESTSKITFTPIVVILFIIGVIVLEIILHFFL